MNQFNKIAVTGGKGGVGKSTVSVLLASQLSKNARVVLVDADVECPNDYFLIGEKLSTQVEKIWAKFPILVKKRCQRCGLCALKCRFNAVFAPQNKYPTFVHKLCANCGLCWHICPEKAIRAKKKQTGEIFENKVSKNLTLITGRTIGVLDESGPVVNALKNYALNKAKKLKAKIVLFDTAPGTHCSVIQALLGLDFAFVVTEPTPLGAHDLKLILEVLQRIGVPSKVVLNQADLGDRNLVAKITNRLNTEIIGEIPYSREIVNLYSQGKLLDFKAARIEKWLKKK